MVLCNSEELHVFKQIPFENQESALTAIKETAVWGVVTFPDNYTQSLKDRMLFGSTAELDSVFGSRIGLKIDTSSKKAFNYMKHVLRYIQNLSFSLKFRRTNRS